MMCGLCVLSTQVLAVLVKHPSEKNKKFYFNIQKEKKKFFSHTITLYEKTLRAA